MRLVLDTNVWLDWLVFGDARVAPLRAAVEAGHAQIFIDAPCEAELARVLAYPLRKPPLDEAAREACLAECRRVAKPIDAIAVTPAPLPRCADPDDQKFLEAALAARAHALVTRDGELLALARRQLPFRIVTPGAFACL